jgi:hypothetical protein
MKAINLPDDVYEDLVDVSKDLTTMAGKSVSVGMTVVLLLEVYRAHLRDPCARDVFRRTLASSNIMSPEEFEGTAETRKNSENWSSTK